MVGRGSFYSVASSEEAPLESVEGSLNVIGRDMPVSGTGIGPYRRGVLYLFCW